VLPKLSAARCRQVWLDPRAARWLEDVEARGLFVSTLKGPELILRLHDLFRDLLEDRLARDLPDEVPELLKRAAACEEDTVRRNGYLLLAGATDEASALLCDDGRSAGVGALWRASSSCLPHLFERSAQRLASYAARPQWEHRIAVGPKGRPPQHEPPVGYRPARCAARRMKAGLRKQLQCADSRNPNLRVRAQQDHISASTRRCTATLRASALRL
jgi:hypothetical protein